MSDLDLPVTTSTSVPSSTSFTTKLRETMRETMPETVAEMPTLQFGISRKCIPLIEPIMDTLLTEVSLR